jgi:hypothetical protein
MQTHLEKTLQAQTKTAIESMKAYFKACRSGAPRQERKKLEQAWLSAVRNLRGPSS